MSGMCEREGKAWQKMSYSFSRGLIRFRGQCQDHVHWETWPFLSLTCKGSLHEAKEDLEPQGPKLM